MSSSALADRDFDEDAPGWFHSVDHWYWRRCANGDVAIVHRVTEPDDRGARITRIIAAHRLTASAWASIVAHVSARGETGPTYREALAFHRTVTPPPEVDHAAASYDAAVASYRTARALELDDTVDERPHRKEPTP